MAIRFKLQWRDGVRGGVKRAEVLVSNEDAYLLRKYIYRISAGGYVQRKDGKFASTLAREILCADAAQDVIYRNGDRSDCRRCNLVLIDRSQRLAMQGHEIGSAEYKTRIRVNGRWQRVAA